MIYVGGWGSHRQPFDTTTKTFGQGNGTQTPVGDTRLVGQQTPATRRSGVLDDFNRADAALTAPNWQAFTGYSTSSIISNQVAGELTTRAQFWMPDVFEGDVEIFATLAAVGDDVYLYCHLDNETGATTPSYAVQWSQSTGRLNLLRDAVNLEFVSQTMAAGDSFGMRVVGGFCRIYYKAAAGSWTALGTGVQNGAYNKGRLAFALPGTSTATRLDNFGGGNAGSSFASSVAVTDSLTLADSAARSAQSLSRAATDALTLADSAVRSAATRTRTATDGVTLSDVAARSAQTPSRTVTDSLTLADVAVGLASKTRTATDSLTLADSPVRSAQAFTRAATDGLTLSDSPAQSSTRSRAISDAVTLSDSLGRGPFAASRAVTDGLTFAESLVRSSLLVSRTVADSVTFAESLVRTPQTLPRAVIDAVSLADSPVRAALSVARAVTDALTLTDSAARTAQLLLRSISDALTVADVANGVFVAGGTVPGHGTTSVSTIVYAATTDAALVTATILQSVIAAGTSSDQAVLTPSLAQSTLTLATTSNAEAS